MKKKNIQSLVIIFFSVLFLIQCTENDILERSYPTIETLQVTDISENGVKLNATINNINQYDIIEYGFVWSVRTFPDINISDKKIISSNLTSGGFSATITTTLVNGNRYYVRSFVKTKDYLVYGNQKEFMSFGSSAALILNLEPNSGVWGDTIQIKGKNFSYVNSNNKITFKDKVASVIKSNDSIITAVVPEGVNSKEVTVGLEIANRETYAATKFIIKSPAITSIAPLTATFGEEITITGDNFGIKPEYNKVYFGDVLAEVSASNKNSIKVIVPNTIKNSSEEIKVQGFNDFIIYPTKFNLKGPQITNTNLNVFIKTETQIEAKYFHPNKDKNKITFEGVDTEVVSVNTNSLTVKVPSGPYPNRTAKIKLEVLDQSTEYILDVNLLDKWLFINNDSPFYNYYSLKSNTVVVENNAYMFGMDLLDGKYNFFTFNGTTKKWSKVDSPIHFNNHTVYVSLEVVDKKIYLYTSEGGNDENFMEYDTQQNTWKTKSKYYEDRSKSEILGLTHFTLNNEVYLGFGKQNFSNSYNTNLEKYNPQTDTWSVVSTNVDLKKNRPTTFVIDNKAYVIGGSEDNNDKSSWSYDANSNTWTQIADFPYSIVNSTSYVLNGKGYVIALQKVDGSIINEIWEYSPANNLWNKVDDFFNEINFIHMFSFSLNNKVYVGGGKSLNTYNFSRNLYEYKPD